MPAAIEARSVSKTYDQVSWVLDDVSLEVRSGEVAVLMGRSGSGKTTLLNLLAGLETPSSGQIVVDGQQMSEKDEDERTELRRDEVGVVFQRFHLIPELTVKENVRLPMKLAGRSDADERAIQLLRFFGMHGHADAYPSTLSGGETQRAAIARALGNKPAVVLADEPTANLDEGNAKNALSALRQVADTMGTAVLIATHDPLAEKAAHRVIDLADGQIQRRRRKKKPKASGTKAEETTAEKQGT